MQLNSDFHKKFLSTIETILGRHRQLSALNVRCLTLLVTKLPVLQRLYALRHRVLLNPTHITEARGTLF